MNNKAAWIPEFKGRPLKIDSAPYTKPGPGQLVIKNAAFAINPVDWKVQEHGFLMQKFPNILGSDVAGHVQEVGEGVTRFKPGDRVISYAIGLPKDNNPTLAGFQLYTVVEVAVTCHIPDSMAFENAVVHPLAISTAAEGLYEPYHLALPFPAAARKQTSYQQQKKCLLVWGGASSVGSTAIQLAVASGLDVITTASARSAPSVKALGAKVVVDYNSPSMTDALVAAVKSFGGQSTFMGIYDAIGQGGWQEVLQKLGGGRVAIVLPFSEEVPPYVTLSQVWAGVLVDHPEVADAVWRDFVPEALETGRLRPRADPMVIPGGLEKVQEGMDRLRQGVSAPKVVVTL
ncbi:hypothetical protein Egran_00183 [Elaphomyces granulatus]|uniref:Enoyl reductase (ER) domain-containing protein n=1 Tax=Elaphomyces granulatus TaxID=519963 RepID=A0A232M7H5_9EURO|nr:hypothetical protein Egran_00183 [Elaphomyces granulatus]